MTYQEIYDSNPGIGRVLDSIKQHRLFWECYVPTTKHKWVGTDRLDALRDLISEDDRTVADIISANIFTTNSSVKYRAQEIVFALRKWDRAADMLDSTPEEIEFLAKLGDNAAWLMHSAVIVLNKIAVDTNVQPTV